MNVSYERKLETTTTAESLNSKTVGVDHQKKDSSDFNSEGLLVDDLLINNSIQQKTKPALHIISSITIQITEFEPIYFLGLRKAFGITADHIINSLNPIENKSNIFKFGEGEGKSGSSFFFTKDNKFLIKTITKNEMNFFIKILPGYVRRIIHVSGSLIAKIFGIFSLKLKGFAPVYFILMENSLPEIMRYVRCILINIYIYIYNRI